MFWPITETVAENNIKLEPRKVVHLSSQTHNILLALFWHKIAYDRFFFYLEEEGKKCLYDTSPSWCGPGCKIRAKSSTPLLWSTTSALWSVVPQVRILKLNQKHHAVRLIIPNTLLPRWRSQISSYHSASCLHSDLITSVLLRLHIAPHHRKYQNILIRT